MRLKTDFITQEIDDEQMLIQVGKEANNFRGIVKSNKTAAFIVNQLKSDTTEEQIIDSILDNYDVEKDIAQRDVRMVIEKLRSINALV